MSRLNFSNDVLTANLLVDGQKIHSVMCSHQEKLAFGPGVGVDLYIHIWGTKGISKSIYFLPTDMFFEGTRESRQGGQCSGWNTTPFRAIL